jgi:hypothetical protein
LHEGAGAFGQCQITAEPPLQSTREIAFRQYCLMRCRSAFALKV